MREPAGPEVRAICLSDIHLSEKPPAARSGESDWFAVMARQLRQVNNLAVFHHCPVLCGGDIFDKPDPKPALINWAIEHLPSMYAIPGQHDLPSHRLEDIKRSAYWTLAEALKITHLEPGKPVEVGDLRLHGFPWGVEVTPFADKENSLLQEVALIHAYCWVNGKCYQGASEEAHLGTCKARLKGYDSVLFGDNHQQWLRGNALNPGSFFRRKSDEKAHTPAVGLLHGDGKFTLHYLDVSDDKFLDVESLPALAGSIGFETLLESLTTLGDAAISFSDAIHRTLEREKVPENVKKLILNALETQK